MDDEYFEDDVDEVSEIYVFTSDEAVKDKKGNWFYVIQGTNIFGEYIFEKEEGQDKPLCGCLECLELGKEVFEYYSACLALTWIKNNYSDCRICLNVGSKRLYDDISAIRFWANGKTFRCAFLRTVGKDLIRLLSELDVEAVHYTYANKDGISVFI